MNIKNNLLVIKNSFLKSITKFLNIDSTRNKHAYDFSKSDKEAISSDWSKIGKDMWKVIKDIEGKENEEKYTQN